MAQKQDRFDRRNCNINKQIQKETAWIENIICVVKISSKINKLELNAIILLNIIKRFTNKTVRYTIRVRNEINIK
jgi:hypothetical protein